MAKNNQAKLFNSDKSDGSDYTAKDIDNWADLVARSIRAAGGRAGDLLHGAHDG